MRKQGAMYMLIGDRAQTEGSKCEKGTLRSYAINDQGFQSEPNKPILSFVPEGDPPQDDPEENTKTAVHFVESPQENIHPPGKHPSTAILPLVK